MAATMRGKRTHDYMAQTLIPLQIGPQSTVIWLYPSILTTNSKFFEKAISDNWRPPQDHGFSFTDVETAIFNQYINWCHLGDLDIVLEKLPQDASSEVCTERFHLLTQIFILADQLDDKVLRNACMDSIISLAASTGWRPGDTTIYLAFSNLPETSTLCRFLIDDALSGIPVEWLKERKDSLPEAYLEALLFGWAKASREKDVKRENPVDVTRCIYHEHDEEVPCDEKCLQDQGVKSAGAKTMAVKTSPKRKR